MGSWAVPMSSEVEMEGLRVWVEEQLKGREGLE